MRITERVRFELPRQRIEALRQRSADANERIATGKRINRPSDDPLGALKVNGLDSQRRRVEQFQRNVDSAEASLRHVEGMLGESTETLYRVKELTIQSLSSVLTQEDAEIIANEIADLREHLRTLANTRIDDRFIFAGFNYDAEPYPEGGGFAGTDDVLQVEGMEGARLDTTIPGGSAFGDGTAATVDVFDNLTVLEEAIRARIGLGVPGEAPVQDELERLEGSIQQMVDARAAAGLRINRVEAARTVNAFFEERLPADIAEHEDADFTAAVSELQLTQTALQATLSAGSQFISGATLVDFLG